MRSLILLVLACACTDAPCQSRLPPGVRGPETAMATRSVSTYLALERRLAGALDDRDADAIRALLDDGFLAHTPVDADGTPASGWIATQSHRRGASRVRDLSVRTFDDLAIVGFLLDDPQAARRRATPATRYVVDVWRVGTQRLLDRYVSDARHATPVPSRPSGRE